MAKGNQNAYRFSLSWPRIILNREGDVNEAGVEFYSRVVDACLEFGIEPYVTLYHWDLPQYWQDEGGWLNPAVADAYVRFARVCFDRLGDRVRYWATFNEPKWFVASGYLIGNYPPGLNDPQLAIRAAFNVMYASACCVQVFRDGRFQGEIGIVHSFSPVDGIDETLETRIAMRYADNYCNNWIMDTAAKGEIPIDLLADLNKRYDLSFMSSRQLDVIADNTVDFLGLNYYSRTLVKPYTRGETSIVVNNTGASFKEKPRVVLKDWFEQVLDDPGMEVTAWGTEIYPDGLRRGLLDVYNRYHLPIYVTENGIGVVEEINAEPIDDEYRISFMRSHIEAIKAAMHEGADVRGYFAWSSFDLYSWKNGCEKRYGLIGVDFDRDLRRIPKKSFGWYRDFIARESTAEK